jgi:hypothetical protein
MLSAFVLPGRRAHSSAVEHSPYKRGVTGSKPVAPTILEHLSPRRCQVRAVDTRSPVRSRPCWGQGVRLRASQVCHSAASGRVRLRMESGDPIPLYRVDARTRLYCRREDGHLVANEALRHLGRGKITPGDYEAAGLVLGHGGNLGLPVADPFVLHEDWPPVLRGRFDPVSVCDLLISWYAVVFGQSDHVPAVSAEGLGDCFRQRGGPRGLLCVRGCGRGRT